MIKGDTCFLGEVRDEYNACIEKVSELKKHPFKNFKEINKTMKHMIELDESLRPYGMHIEVE